MMNTNDPAETKDAGETPWTATKDWEEHIADPHTSKSAGKCKTALDLKQAYTTKARETL